MPASRAITQYGSLEDSPEKIFSKLTFKSINFGANWQLSVFEGGVMRYWRGYLSRARCKWFAYNPADATATSSSLASSTPRMVLPFWCQLTQVVPEKRPLHGVVVNETVTQKFSISFGHISQVALGASMRGGSGKGLGRGEPSNPTVASLLTLFSDQSHSQCNKTWPNKPNYQPSINPASK